MIFEKNECSVDVASSYVGFSPLIVKRDEEGFAESFSLEDSEEEIRLFFQKYGFVVFRNIIPAEDCDKTVNQFFKKYPAFHIKNGDTYKEIWKDQRFGHLGIMNASSPYTPNCDISPQLLINRMNPNLYQAYKILFQTERIYVDHDRIGVMRPTKNIPFSDGVVADKPDWKTADRWIHLDCNPDTGRCSVAGLLYENKKYIDLEANLVVQGIIALTDAHEDDGGFHCIPGFHKYVKAYTECLSNTSAVNGRGLQVPDSDPIREYVQKIPLRKGSICVWNTLTLHGNYPNDSSNFRAVQYCRMASHPYFQPLITDIESYNQIEVTELGKKVFGIESW
jgi:ectoine hydroxylase-related dioxygenase (phytanoyl-CoA dioxygenase family)